MRLIGFRILSLKESALYGVSIKTSREKIVVLPDWSAYHEHSGRGPITSSRPTVLSFQLLFNYANCPPPSPGLSCDLPAAIRGAAIVKLEETSRDPNESNSHECDYRHWIAMLIICWLIYSTLCKLSQFFSYYRFSRSFLFPFCFVM